MPKPWNVCDTMRDEYTVSWGNEIVFVLDHSFYDTFLCADFLGGGCAGTATLGTDVVCETTLRYVVGWDERNGYFRVSSDGNVGRG